jgi:hypothetical protein
MRIAEAHEEIGRAVVHLLIRKDRYSDIPHTMGP